METNENTPPCSARARVPCSEHTSFYLFCNDFTPRVPPEHVFRVPNTPLFVCFVMKNTRRGPSEHAVFRTCDAGTRQFCFVFHHFLPVLCSVPLGLYNIKRWGWGIALLPLSTLYGVPVGQTGNTKFRKNFMSGTVSILRRICVQIDIVADIKFFAK